MQKLALIAVVAAGLFTAKAHADAPRFWNRIAPVAKKQNPSYFDGATPTVTYDESLNYQPGVNLYREAAQLTDLFGANGSQLCAPIAITHGFTYLKYPAGFSQLATIPDMDKDGTLDTYRDKIRYFFSTCKTDKENGTFYSDAINCMREYVELSGYKAYVYMVGAHATTSPPGVPLPTMKHTVNITDVRTYVGHRLMVVAGIGWYEFNAPSNTYKRVGGHFVDFYGYDYSLAWGDSQMVLKVVNSWVDYTGRDRTMMYDDVQLTKVPADGTQYPAEIQYELRGQGFNFPQRAFLEDLFVALPQVQ